MNIVYVYLQYTIHDFSHVSKLLFPDGHSNSVSRLKTLPPYRKWIVATIKSNAIVKLAKFCFDHVMQGGCFVRVYQKAFQLLTQSVHQKDAATQEVFSCIV